MAIFKCKMCGGALEINNETVVTCEYCGTQQTLPKLDDERRANLYDRANHFRRNNEYDKAMDIYEQILNEDKTDAEAYWSLVLCSYGIEYVEDPASHKRIPTVNRAQFTSVFDDDNYKSALAYADSEQKSLYEAEAEAINEIQKGILAISQKEEPFDVFICYKETDNGGRRTPDSVLANDLYHQLTQEGFKVFFSRITLEDKLGTAYEPYIFAALNSAKVMVVLGTKPEFFNAVWVKNEWSRYLALVKSSNGKKMLIPAYKDMDPYDLPTEFSHLQAQDMSKLGFMQDLIRGIKKIAQTDEPKTTVVKETVVAEPVATAAVAPLLRRVFMFLEDGDFARADEFCEQVLNQEPENAEAYLGKLMAELKVKKREGLANCDNPFNDKPNYQKIIRFGSDELKAELEGYIKTINDRNKEKYLRQVYNRASDLLVRGTSEDQLRTAAEKFKSISGYKDADALAEECLKLAEIARKDAILNQGKRKMTASVIAEIEDAIKLFESISGWEDADECIGQCRNKIEEIKANAEIARKDAILNQGKQKMIASVIAEIEDAIKLFESVPGWKDADECAEKCRKRIEELKAKAEKDKATNKKIATIATIAIAGIIVVAVLVNNVFVPAGKYKDAVKLMEAQNYSEAIAVFESLDGYKDSEEKKVECVAAQLTKNTEKEYNRALNLMETKKYAEAIELLRSMNGYKDSADKIKECYPEIYGHDLWNKIKNAKVGDTIKIGKYEQDGISGNGAEDIEWIVLASEGDKILVISKYALTSKYYHFDCMDTTWAGSSIRRWLNADFADTAFSENIKAAIPTTTVSADANPQFTTDVGIATEDKIFLLSVVEAQKYFVSDIERLCKPTVSAVQDNNIWIYKDNCYWWLRTPGSAQDVAAHVNSVGEIDQGFVDASYIGVRPAMWLAVK